MPTTSCNHCGAPAFITEADRDHGAEAYCSEGCASAKASDPAKLGITPGPWSVGPQHRENEGKKWLFFSYQTHIVHPNGLTDIAIVESSEEEGEANARLISAATELLAACLLWDKGFQNSEEFTAAQFVKWVNDNRAAARAAVAKATGRADQ